MNEIIGIIVASVICWLNFVIIDTYFGLPQQPGVKGVQTVGDSIEKRNGDIAGGFFQGNILCSPDASAGTLIASIGYMILGIPGVYWPLSLYLWEIDCVQIQVMLELPVL